MAKEYGFQRTLSPEFQELLKNQFSFLIQIPLEDFPGNPYLYDVQLRPGDEVKIYNGLTRVAVISYIKSKSAIKISANKYYADFRPEVMGTWQLEDADILRGLYLKYIHDVHHHVLRKDFHSLKEGFWQNKLSSDFSYNFSANDEWLIVDREVVVQHPDAKRKQDHLTEFQDPCNAVVRALRDENPSSFGRMDQKLSFGDELDALAIGKDGKMILIELKHGTNAKGIYWAPLQISVYSSLAMLDAQEFWTGAIKLARQRVSLGLIRDKVAAEERISMAETIGDCEQLPRDAVQPAVVVAQPNGRSTCWANGKRVSREFQDRRPDISESELWLLGNSKWEWKCDKKIQPVCSSFETAKFDIPSKL